MAKSSNSFFGWLGRQVGSVKGAVKADVKPPPKVVYQKTTVHEVTLPDRPDEKLRRTIIDEVVVARPTPAMPAPAAPPPPQTQSEGTSSDAP